MSNEMRKVTIRTEAVQALRDLVKSFRAEAKTKTSQARAIEVILKGHVRVKVLEKVVNLQVNGKRPAVPAAIRRELERAAADLEKRAARIKAVPITGTERALSKRKENASDE